VYCDAVIIWENYPNAQIVTSKFEEIFVAIELPYRGGWAVLAAPSATQNPWLYL